MCGIVGVVNGKKDRRVNSKLPNYLRDAIIADSVRGADSTGIFQCSKDTKKARVWWHKKAVSGVEFVEDATTTSLLRDVDDTAFTVAHNRAATRGEVTDDNAHPFEAFSEAGDWLMGVHNGTLTGWDTAADAKEYKVDSAWAMAQIAEKGVDAFKTFVGAYTFVWYGDREGESINMIRNYARPMFVAYVKGENRMLFASEYMMMVWLAQRNELSLEEEIIELDPGYLYSFSLENPREFTKKQVQTYVTVSKEDQLYESIETLFKPKKADKPSKSVALIPLGPNKQSTEDKEGVKHVTGNESRLAKRLELIGKRVNFVPEHYDNTAKELWGTVTIKPNRGMEDLYSAVIRGVDTAMYNTWSRATSLSARVTGAQTSPVGITQEVSLILSRKVGVKEESDVNNELARVLSETMSINEVQDGQQGKAN